MVSFIHCFAQKSKICHRINAQPTEGAQDKRVNDDDDEDKDKEKL